MSAEKEILNMASEVIKNLVSPENINDLSALVAEANSRLQTALQSSLFSNQEIEQRLEDISFVSQFFSPDEFVIQEEIREQINYVGNEFNALVVSGMYADPKQFLSKVETTINNPSVDVALSDINQFYTRVNGTLPTPTGKPSKLTANQQQHVRSQLFMSWFGDWIKAYEKQDYTGVSTLIDPDTAEPLLLFHGTAPQQAFWRFDMGRTMSPVTYASDDFEYAAWYPRNEAKRGDRQAVRGGIPMVYQLFGLMRNPLDFRMFGVSQFEGEEVADIIDVFTGYRPENIYAINPSTKQKMPKAPLIWYFRYNPDLIREIKTQTSFDGIIFLGINPGMIDQNTGKKATENEFLFFKNTQLKLAHARFNSGFVQDIRMKKGGQV